MLDCTENFDLTQRDLELIEAALQTQEKILAVQSRAGSRAARERMNEVKSLLRRVRRACPEHECGQPTSRFWNFTRAIFS